MIWLKFFFFCSWLRTAGGSSSTRFVRQILRHTPQRVSSSSLSPVIQNSTSVRHPVIRSSKKAPQSVIRSSVRCRPKHFWYRSKHFWYVSKHSCYRSKHSWYVWKHSWYVSKHSCYRSKHYLKTDLPLVGATNGKSVTILFQALARSEIHQLRNFSLSKISKYYVI